MSLRVVKDYGGFLDSHPIRLTERIGSDILSDINTGWFIRLSPSRIAGASLAQTIGDS